MSDIANSVTSVFGGPQATIFLLLIVAVFLIGSAHGEDKVRLSMRRKNTDGRCPGFNDHGKPFNCTNPPNPTWCPPCDTRRLDTMGAQFQALRDRRQQ